MKIRLLLAVLALALALSAVASTPASAREVFTSSGCGKSVSEPREMILTCGEDDLRLYDIEWDSWAADSATATAVISHPLLIDPSCDGLPSTACPIVEYPATVTLSRPVHCSSNGRWQFTRLRVVAPEDAEAQFRDMRRSYRCSEHGLPPQKKKPRKPKRHRYWFDCGYPDVYNPTTVIVHKVPCRKAMRVLRGVWRLGQSGGVGIYLPVKDFSCTFKLGSPRIHVCTKGSKEIRGPASNCGHTCDPNNSWARASADAPRDVRVQAEFTEHREPQGESRGLRMLIWRDGYKVLDRAPLIPCGGCHPHPMPTGLPLQPPVEVIQLDRTPEPEVVFQVISDGEYCCSWGVIFRWDDALQRYLATTHNFLDLTPERRKHGYQGLPVFVDTDHRLGFEFTCFRCISYPPQVWAYRDGKMLDVTRSFPGRVRRSLDRANRIYRTLAGESDVRGTLATIVADRCLLGDCGAGLAQVRRALRAGHLAPQESRYEHGPHGREYVPALRRLLRRLGYL